MNCLVWPFAVLAAALPGTALTAPSSIRLSTLPSAVGRIATSQEREALETRIEAAAQIAYSVWRLERLHSALGQMHFEAGDARDKPNPALGALNAALRSDQQMSIDTYTKLVREIASVADEFAVTAAMAAVEAELADSEHPAMKIMLRTLAEHVAVARTDNIPTRDQMLDDIVTHSAKRR